MRNFFRLSICIITLSVLAVSCKSKSKGTDALTGWKLNDADHGGFAINTNYDGMETPPGMVLIEGGTFTMGRVQEDIMGDWNAAPRRLQVRSFFMDEAEVSNSSYLFYLLWLERVFPPQDENYQHIYNAALPDTLVWRNVLGNNESLSEIYLRNPAFAEYPVVGINWLQANDFCKWRTDRVNEKVLMEMGVLKDLFNQDSIEVKGKNHFNTKTYYTNPNLLFEGNEAVYDQGLESLIKKPSDSVKEGGFEGRHVKPHDGMLYPDFRLPTEAEWEYAAKANIENREYNNLRGRKKYPWNGRYTRYKDKRTGDQMANFKQGKGDYSGLAGWSNDGADITRRIKSYKPNAFGLYDMAGNVAEWVYDVYRPVVASNLNDFNYVRGNEFLKKKLNEDGKIGVADYADIEYDTLENGSIRPKNLPGEIMYEAITKNDAYMRTNYNKSYNVNYGDGDINSTRQFRKTQEELEKMPRMYNAPVIPKAELNEETGEYERTYDKKKRNTLIADNTRVYKGGSWKDREYWLDPSQRRFLPQYMATDYIGFRCAMDNVAEPEAFNKKTPFHTN